MRSILLFLVLFAGAKAFTVLDENLERYGNNTDLLVAENEDCRCENGRCVTDKRGKMKCACNPKHSPTDDETCKPCDCGNKGKCIFQMKLQDGIVQYKKLCVCDKGSAEKDGICVDCQCGQNSLCEFEGEEKLCYCEDGYSEKYGVCTKCDCGENSEDCKFEASEKVCQCKEGFAQKEDGTCRVPCRDSCFNHGECKGNGKHKFCDCKKGTSGELCEIVDDCLQQDFCGLKKDVKCVYNEMKNGGDCKCNDASKLFNPVTKKCEIPCQNNCANGGTCNRHGDRSFCVCKPGTSGDLCDIVDDCTKKGFCGYKRDVKCVYNGISGGQCVCDDRRKKFDAQSGKCRIPCEGNCNNGGQCVTVGNARFCSCKEGTSGDLCEIVDDCNKVNFCGRKDDVRCVYDGHKGGTCVCKDNAKSFNSAAKECRKQCRDSDCKNEGKCYSQGDLNFCSCKPGTSGDHCEIIKECIKGGSLEKCEEGNGKCIFVNGAAKCKCPPGQEFDKTKGKCRKQCFGSDCKNEGNCKYHGEFDFCACKEGTSGDHCEIINDCVKGGSLEGCEEGNGKCVFVNGAAKCVCPTGEEFDKVQRRCRIPCHDNCANGGTCNRHGDRSFCVCKPGTSGDLCEIVDDCTKKGFCGYKGDVKCVYNGISGGQCICDDQRKKFDAQSGKCRIPCHDNCANGGVCNRHGDRSFCVCKPGTNGDLCEIVDDCTKKGFCGYKGDVKCVYNGISGGQCVCDDRRKKFDAHSGKCRRTCINNDDCGKGGNCLGTMSSPAYCECHEGYEGDLCEVITGCKELGGKCAKAGGTCVFDSREESKAICLCKKENYVYDRVTEKCHPICINKTDCGVGGSCVDGKFCYCKDGYEGVGCSIVTGCKELGRKCDLAGALCVFDEKAANKARCQCIKDKHVYDPISGSCKPSCNEKGDCGIGGTCVNGKYCDCKEGFEGVGCDVITGCKEGLGDKCSRAGGKCVFDDSAVNRAKCLCNKEKHLYDKQSGRCIWSCENDNDCHHGSKCSPGSGGLNSCHCPPGTSGDKCDVVDDCETGRLKNCRGKNGSCSFDIKKGISVCKCGKDQRFDVVKNICRDRTCTEATCRNGRCEDVGNTEVCKCYEGYAMIDGECRKLKCTKTPCIGGECIVRHGNIEECVCPAGFALHKGKCRRGTCRVGTCFGGRCETIQGELICVCPRGYHLIGIGCHGTQCQKKRCFGGVCKVVEDTEEEICTCYEGYELIGDVCQLKLCKHKSCFGGQCHIVDGKEECSCPSGYILYDDVCRLNRL